MKFTNNGAIEQEPFKNFKNNQIINYDKYTNYDLPFIYYSQADTIGIDIKQEKYPIMNGLCIIDKTLQYSQVAQGMFRLRKLNLYGISNHQSFKINY